jgi:hypothetical protein
LRVSVGQLRNRCQAGAGFLGPADFGDSGAWLAPTPLRPCGAVIERRVSLTPLAAAFLAFPGVFPESRGGRRLICAAAWGDTAARKRSRRSKLFRTRQALWKATLGTGFPFRDGPWLSFPGRALAFFPGTGPWLSFPGQGPGFLSRDRARAFFPGTGPALSFPGQGPRFLSRDLAFTDGTALGLPPAVLWS